jgi:thiamine pyrophosphate-dependent acetolactate synthase large subunit-like protein
MSSTVTDVLLDAMATAGVRRIFGIPGDAINAVIDGIRRHPDLTFVHVRHEEAGAFAASAQAKLTGELAAVVGTAGPGAVHLLNGLMDAALDHAPVIAVTGQVETAKLGTHAHQEVDQSALFSGVAVFSETIVDPGQISTLAMQACQAALSAPGVAHLALPGDVATAAADPLPQVAPVPAPSPMAPDDEALMAAVEVLAAAEKPLILAGIGCRGAVPALVAVAERLGAPIIKTLRAKALLADDHPLTVGGLGLLGTRPAVNAIADCDALLMVGTDFPYTDFYPDHDVPAVQIDRERSRIGRRFPVSAPVVADAAPALEALLGRLPHRHDHGFLDAAQEDMRRWRRWMRRLETSEAVPLKPERVAAVTGAYLDDDAIIVCDTGTVTAWTARHLAARDGQQFTLSGNLASMAYGIPAAIGAQLAHPDRQVVALVGDGSFTMLPSDLMTAAELGLPITVVVFDNGKLGLITVEEESEGFAEQQTGIPPRDLARIAEAFGAEGYRARTPAELDEALRTALRSPRPAVVAVAVDPDELIIPPKIELAQALGYAEAKVKEFFGIGRQEGGFDVIFDVLR